MENNQSDSKLHLVNAGAKTPMGLYSVIVVVTIGSLISAISFLEPGFAQNALIIIIGIILVMIVYLVGTRVLGKTIEVKQQYPSHGEKISESAQKGWFYGGNAKTLEGAWEVRWYSLDEEGKRKPYMIKNKHGDLEEYPAEQAQVTAEGAMISINNADRSTGYNYFLEGRLTEKNIVTLTYWSQPTIKESALVGVLLLELSDSFDKTTMSGSWIGYSRKNQIVSGEVEFLKVTKNIH